LTCSLSATFGVEDEFPTDDVPSFEELHENLEITEQDYIESSELSIDKGRSTISIRRLLGIHSKLIKTGGTARPRCPSPRPPNILRLVKNPSGEGQEESHTWR
jgi:hypothetical protein